MKALTIAAALGLVLAAAGCEQEGSGERIGRNIDETADELGDRAEELGERAREAGEDVRRRVDEATSDRDRD
jgi:hypothetical protein